MVERSDRRRVGEEPRGAADPQWEVFVRETETEPLQHVGSVSAPASDVAHAEATTLFGRDATDVWLCPAAEVRRYSTRSLADRADAIAPGAGADDGGDSTP